MYGIYCRLNIHVLSSNLTVIRVIRKKFRKQILYDHKKRKFRHQTYRLLIKEHEDARKLYLSLNHL